MAELFGALGRGSRKACVFAASAVMAGTAVVVSAPTASAASCGQVGVDRQPGQGTVTASALARRSGPFTSCAALGQVSKGTKINYYCFEIGTAVNGNKLWTYGEVAGTGQKGWFASAYLDDDGASLGC
ncbi:SH3 domain-containing protein [Streptomyces sp. NPDC005813]|uniref:SH3 domain-containing protein n=1 Tax=Streptomyces sp. NPDC005813 TaxID=3155592 RepID=UPI0033D9A69C